MLSRLAWGVAVAGLVLAGLGWGSWWLRGRQVEDARARCAALARGLSVCHRNLDRVTRALAEQEAAVQELRRAADEAQARVNAAVARADRIEAEARASAAEADRLAAELRERMNEMTELEACRAAWVALSRDGSVGGG